MIQDALSAGNAIVATLVSPSGRDGHAVMIYGCNDEIFKIKDSHGNKYEIPINRPDYHQVINHRKRKINFNQIHLGKTLPVHKKWISWNRSDFEPNYFDSNQLVAKFASRSNE